MFPKTSSRKTFPQAEHRHPSALASSGSAPKSFMMLELLLCPEGEGRRDGNSLKEGHRPHFVTCKLRQELAEGGTRASRDIPAPSLWGREGDKSQGNVSKEALALLEWSFPRNGSSGGSPCPGQAVPAGTGGGWSCCPCPAVTLGTRGPTPVHSDWGHLSNANLQIKKKIPISSGQTEVNEKVCKELLQQKKKKPKPKQTLEKIQKAAITHKRDVEILMGGILHPLCVSAVPISGVFRDADNNIILTSGAPSGSSGTAKFCVCARGRARLSSEIIPVLNPCWLGTGEHQRQQ